MKLVIDGIEHGDLEKVGRILPTGEKLYGTYFKFWGCIRWDNFETTIIEDINPEMMMEIKNWFRNKGI